MFCCVWVWMVAGIAQQQTPLPDLEAHPSVIPVAYSPQPAAAKPRLIAALDDVVKDVVELFLRGSYGEVIDSASTHLTQGQQLDTRLLYLRGAAAWRVGFFAFAERDLSQIGNFTPPGNWAPTSAYSSKIQKVKRVIPPRVFEVRDGKDVVFRVFYSADDAWTSSIVKLLPRAYQINHKILGNKVTETQVFIFKNYNDFKTFYDLKTDGLAPGNWAWAAADAGIMYFCEGVPGADPAAYEVDSDYFQCTIVHEFNHSLVTAASGSASMPIWLREGLAMVAQSRSSQANSLSNLRRMRNTLSVNGILPLSELSSRDRFVANNEAYVSRKGTYGPDAYTQVYFMASYFLSQLPEGGLEAFLTDLARERDFDAVFEKHMNGSLDAFYRGWLAQLPSQLS